MGRQQRLASAGLLVGTVLLVGCGIGGTNSGSASNAEWTLEGVSPDRQHLVVSTLFGGVASGCSRFEGWEVKESEGAVEINARLWQKSAPSGCTDEGVVEYAQVDLEQPLGDRELIGCGVEECLDTVSDGGNLMVGQVIVAGEALAVADESGLDAYSLEGDVLSESPGATSGEALAVGDGIVVRNDRQGAAIAVDLRTGDEIWRTTGWLAEVAEGVVYVCRGQDSDGLTAIDPADGADVWQTDLPCESLVVHGSLLTVIGPDRTVDGGHRVTVVDAANGESVLDEALFDGIDDQVTGFDRAIAVGSNTVVAGPQANLVVLAEDGTEVAREIDGLGVPMGEADGVAVFGSYEQLVGFDVTEQSELWARRVDAFRSVSVDDGSVWLLNQAGAQVSRIDPLTGEALWSVPVGLTTSFDVASEGFTAYIVTTQSVIAADNNTGELRWSRHRSYESAG